MTSMIVDFKQLELWDVFSIHAFILFVFSFNCVSEPWNDALIFKQLRIEETFIKNLKLL